MSKYKTDVVYKVTQEQGFKIKKLDLKGQRFYRLLIQEEVGRDKHNNVLWSCLCDCGNVTTVTSANLRRGTCKSCGCYCKEVNTIHGLKHHPLYSIYNAMKNRCTRPTNPAYGYYGARGIRVCERWLEPDGVGFLNFIEDMGERPDGYTLDRKDNDGDYNSSNCRWVTKQQNQWNKRSTVGSSCYKGVHWSTRDRRWIASIKINGELVSLGSYYDEVLAATAYNEKAVELFGEFAYLNIFNKQEETIE